MTTIVERGVEPGQEAFVARCIALHQINKNVVRGVHIGRRRMRSSLRNRTEAALDQRRSWPLAADKSNPGSPPDAAGMHPAPQPHGQ